MSEGVTKSKNARKTFMCICNKDDPENFSISYLTHFYVELPRKIPRRRKREGVDVLMGYLDALWYRQAVIYCSSVERCAFLTQFLENRGYPVLGIHQMMPMTLRMKYYQDFNRDDTEWKILVTSGCGHSMEMKANVDVAFCFDEPDSSALYCHRVSTRKDGRKGLVLSFVRERYKKRFVRIVKEVEQMQNVIISPVPDWISVSDYMEDVDVTIELDFQE